MHSHVDATHPTILILINGTYVCVWKKDTIEGSVSELSHVYQIERRVWLSACVPPLKSIQSSSLVLWLPTSSSPTSFTSSVHIYYQHRFLVLWNVDQSQGQLQILSSMKLMSSFIFLFRLLQERRWADPLERLHHTLSSCKFRRWLRSLDRTRYRPRWQSEHPPWGTPSMLLIADVFLLC